MDLCDLNYIRDIVIGDELTVLHALSLCYELLLTPNLMYKHRET